MYAELGESRNNKSMANYSMLQLSFDSTYSLPECSVESFCDVNNVTDRVEHNNLRNGNHNNDSSDDENHEFIDDNKKEEYDYGNNIAHSNNFEQSNDKYSNSIQDKMYGFDNDSIDNIDDDKFMYEEVNSCEVQTNENQQLEFEGHREEEKQKQHQERVQQWLQQIQRRLSLSSKASNHTRSHQSESYEEEEIELGENAENSNNFDYIIPDKSIITTNSNNNNSSKETYSPNQNGHVSKSLESTTLMPTYTKTSQKEAMPEIQEHEEEEEGEEQLEENHGRYTKRQSISTSYALQNSKTPKLTPLENFYLLEYDETPNNNVNGSLHKEVSTNINNDTSDKEKCESHITSNKLFLPRECAVDKNVSHHNITQHNCDKDNFNKEEESHNNTDLILPPVHRHHNEQQTHHHNNSYKSVIYNNTEQQQDAQERLIRQCKLPKETQESKEYSPSLKLHNHPLHSKAKQVSAGQSSTPSTMGKATFTPLTPFSYLTPSWEMDTNDQNMYKENIEDDVIGQNNTISSTNTYTKKSKEKSNTDSCWGNSRQNDKENSNSRNNKGNTNCIKHKANISKNLTDDNVKNINANTTAVYLASELLDKGEISLEQNQNKTHKAYDVANTHKTNNTKAFSRKDVQSSKSPHSWGKENKHNNDRTHEIPHKMRSNSIVEADHTNDNNDKLEIVSKQIKQPTNCQTSVDDVTTNNTLHTDVVTSPVSATKHVPYSLAKYNKIQLPTLTSHEPTRYSYYDDEVDNVNKNSNDTNSDNSKLFAKWSNTENKVNTVNVQEDENKKSLNIRNNNKFGNNELEKLVNNNQRQLKWNYLQEVVALNDISDDNNNVTSTKTRHPKSYHEYKNIDKSEILGADNVENHNSSEHNTSHVIHSAEQQSVHSTNTAGLSVGNAKKPRSNSLDTGLMHQGKHGILLKRFSYLSQPLPEQQHSNEDITNNKNKHKYSFPFSRATWMSITTPPALNVSSDAENEFSTSLEEKIAKHEIVVDEVELLRQQRDKTVEHHLDTDLDNRTKEHQHTKEKSETQKEELNLSSQNILNIYNNDIADERDNSIISKNNKCNDGNNKPTNSKSNVTLQEGQNKRHSYPLTKHDSLTKVPCQESNNNAKTKRFVPITSIVPLSASMLSNDQSLSSLSIPSFYRLSLHDHEIGNKNSNHNNNSENSSNTKESVLEYTTGADGTQSKSDNANQNDDSTYLYKHDGSNTNNEIVDYNNGKSEIDTNVVNTDETRNDVTSGHDETHGRHSVSFAPDVIFFKH